MLHAGVYSQSLTSPGLFERVSRGTRLTWRLRLPFTARFAACDGHDQAVRWAAGPPGGEKGVGSRFASPASLPVAKLLLRSGRPASSALRRDEVAR